MARSAKLAHHLDFGKKAILPGAIDLHVHFREPGLTHKEDWRSGTTSAAFGGVTTVVDMPNTAPPTTTLKAMDDKLAVAGRSAVVDFSAWSGATWYMGDLPKMLERSVGLKMYLGASTGDLLMQDDARVREALEIAGKAGKPAILHCEAERVLRQQRRTETNLRDHDLCRPPLAEVEAIYDVMKALPALRTSPVVHVAHIASADAVAAASSAGFSMGVCPHHLLLDTTCCEDEPALGKMNPPLRSPEQREALWRLFASGAIPILESDHAPHTRPEKAESFHAAPAGVPGVETLLPLMLARAAAGDVALKTVVDAVTRAPARLLGVRDRGALARSKRADFSVVDLDDVVEVRGKELHAKCGWTPFEGHDAVFPTHTFLAGRPVVEERRLVAEPGSGRPLLGVD